MDRSKPERRDDIKERVDNPRVRTLTLGDGSAPITLGASEVRLTSGGLPPGKPIC